MAGADEMQMTVRGCAIWVMAAMAVSCGPLPESQHAASAPVCTSVEHAQHAGYTDGSSNQPSQAPWLMNTCPAHTRDAIAAGYTDGHTRGLAEHRATMARNVEAARQAQAQQAEAARQAESQHLQRLCTDGSTAFQAGYNSGYRREPMSADWADRYCAPADRASTKQQYIAGYQAGIGQAPPPPQPPPVTPVIVVAPRSGGAAVPNGQTTCRFSSDCYEGQSCRNVSGLGRSVCMGDGVRGDYCWFSSDCLSDSCRLHSGGAKTCK